MICTLLQKSKKIEIITNLDLLELFVCFEESEAVFVSEF